jgi:hypothetical protein
MVTYYIVQSGASKAPELHKLVLKIKQLEIDLGCQLEVMHTPGTTLISEGTNGLRQGLDDNFTVTPDTGGSNDRNFPSHHVFADAFEVISVEPYHGAYCGDLNTCGHFLD